ncbi:MAG: NrfD/PsrC family molybdoenzyme membrane anchor subunit, partial [Phycisphaerales bacterium]
MTTAPVNKPDNTIEDPSNRPKLILNHTDFGSVTTDILRANESPKPPKSWYFALAVSFTMMS